MRAAAGAMVPNLGAAAPSSLLPERHGAVLLHKAAVQPTLHHCNLIGLDIDALLEEAGFKVTAMDLTASGIHSSDSNSITNLSQYRYVEPLADFLENLAEREKVVESAIHE
ncbi:hypothetical protein L484_022952 [Morus notabilis]|uniref:Uncharacterized protein n=1 Tax=Morus notabilis TaxID=981085 RepID=W9QTT6_9ROSA|nr:hypothetical protein L484_022952 [Morus notabilis]